MQQEVADGDAGLVARTAREIGEVVHDRRVEIELPFVHCHHRECREDNHLREGCHVVERLPIGRGGEADAQVSGAIDKALTVHGDGEYRARRRTGGNRRIEHARGRSEPCGERRTHRHGRLVRQPRRTAGKRGEKHAATPHQCPVRCSPAPMSHDGGMAMGACPVIGPPLNASATAVSVRAFAVHASRYV